MHYLIFWWAFQGQPLQAVQTAEPYHHATCWLMAARERHLKVEKGVRIYGATCLTAEEAEDWTIAGRFSYPVILGYAKEDWPT